ncbi:MAG: NADH-quinone oxidoreductase subunit NuoH [Armatimonadetes bacterium]|nr:NADH-quinone oxidoreductase subunit NuoH [Armatimonadota bacterium]
MTGGGIIPFILGAVLRIAVVLLFLLLFCVPFLIWMERRVMALMQARVGPNRVGPFGLLQPIADGIKLFFKEDITPTGVDKVVYYAAPIVVLIPAIVTFSVIPFGSIFPHQGTAIAPGVNVGLLFAFAMMSLSVYGVVLAGWASNNKYSLLGSLRSSAQMISYELTLGLSVIGVLMLAGSLNLMEIVRVQQLPILPGTADTWLQHFKNWFVFKQPIGFALYLIASMAETARIPFDLPEAEGELVAGFHTEYSSMKFATFFMAEYAFVVAHSALMTVLFFGGWSGPLLPGIFWFLLKVFSIIFFFMWVRSTLPRFRYDQLMNFGWKILLPIALVNVFVTGILISLLNPQTP